MVKGVLSRLITNIRGPSDTIPYGTHEEEQTLHVVTPVKYAMVLEHSVTATVVPSQPADSVGFVQKVRNSLRRKKKNRDYDLFADRPSPFRTPPPFLADQAPVPAAPNWDSPFGMEVLEECITKKKAGQKQFKLDFSRQAQEELHSQHQILPLLTFENEENGSESPSTSAPTESNLIVENVGFDPDDSSIDAYFKTPEGIRKYHRRSKVFLSSKEDHLI